MPIKATVLIPTHNHGEILLRSTQSALRQTVQEIEILIVGDGASDQTRESAKELVRMDRRIRFIDNPKGPARGETHRHAALTDACGQIICYLTDDSLWLPNHLEVMVQLLKDCDFSHTLPTRIEPDGSLGAYCVDLSHSGYRKLMNKGINQIPLSAGAHTLDFYRKLPFGWRAAPRGYPSDLYMWQQILNHPRCRAVSNFEPTTITFPSWARKNWTKQNLLAELDSWSTKLTQPGYSQQFKSEILATVVKERSEKLAAIPAWAWHLGKRLLRHPAFGNRLRLLATAVFGPLPR